MNVTKIIGHTIFKSSPKELELVLLRELELARKLELVLSRELARELELVLSHKVG